MTGACHILNILASYGSYFGFDLMLSTSPGEKCLEEMYVYLLIDATVNSVLAQR